MKKDKSSNVDESIKDALIKRALGYEAVDEVKEYAVDENEKMKLTKKKITKKFVSPDISAAKTLLEYYFNENKNDLEQMTDDELLAERERLLKLLKDAKEDESEEET